MPHTHTSPGRPGRAALALAVALALAAAATPADAGPETTFSYQGVLEEGGQPVTGARTLRFNLTTDPTGKSVAGGAITQTVDIAAGLFTVSLDFADDIVEAYANVPGEPQWHLLVEVQEPDLSFTKLLPPQPITAVPFSTNTRGIKVDTDKNALLENALIVGDVEVQPDATTTILNFDLDDGRGRQNMLAFSPLPEFSMYARLGPTPSGETGALSFLDAGDLMATLGGEPGPNSSNRGRLALYGGNNQRGSGSESGIFQLYHGQDDLTFELRSIGGGSAAQGFDQTTGQQIYYLGRFGGPMPDGAILRLMRDNAGNIGIEAAGAGSSGSPRLALTDDAQSAVIDLSLTGGASVQLPDNAINSSEMLDEPGVASNSNIASDYGVHFAGIDNIGSAAITTPGPGYVIAMMTCNIAFFHNDNSKISEVWISLTDVSHGFENVRGYATMEIPPASPVGFYQTPASITRVFPVASAGTHRYYLTASSDYTPATHNQTILTSISLQLIYFPTAYGSVVTSLGDFSPPPPDKDWDDLVAQSDLNPGKPALGTLRMLEADNADLRRRLDEQQAILDQLLLDSAGRP